MCGRNSKQGCVVDSHTRHHREGPRGGLLSIEPYKHDEHQHAYTVRVSQNYHHHTTSTSHDDTQTTRTRIDLVQHLEDAAPQAAAPARAKRGIITAPTHSHSQRKRERLPPRHSALAS